MYQEGSVWLRHTESRDPRTTRYVGLPGVSDRIQSTFMDATRLAISSEMLARIPELPSKVRAKLFDLVDKFERDSKSAAIHLEPISTFADPLARTARLGDDYRAVIVAPERGNCFLLVHVDHHDEAMRWARN